VAGGAETRGVHSSSAIRWTEKAAFLSAVIASTVDSAPPPPWEHLHHDGTACGEAEKAVVPTVPRGAIGGADGRL
jgi:hypothetical protein